VDPEGDDLLVVGAVEDPDAAALGQGLDRPPQEVVVQLLAGGLLEGDDVHPLGVHPGHDVLDGGVLAGRVQGLEHHQHGVGVARPQQLLGLGELLDPVVEQRLGGMAQLLGGQLLELRPPGPGRVPAGDVRLRARLDDQLLDDAFASAHAGPLPITATGTSLVASGQPPSSAGGRVDGLTRAG
jgi:hypothetical protein